LRQTTNGECSAAAGDCLAAGTALVITAIGAQRELPDDVAVKVPVAIGASDLAVDVADLLDDAPRRQALAHAARAYVEAASFPTIAAELAKILLPNWAG
jgi:hypothetical protein